MHELARTREVDGAIVVSVDLVDHILQLRLGRVLAQWSHDCAELLGGDLSYTAFVLVLSCSVYLETSQTSSAQYRGWYAAWVLARERNRLDKGQWGRCIGAGGLTIAILIL